jgi:hypothetical protein
MAHLVKSDDVRGTGSRQSSVLDGIGNTPLIQVDGIWAKLEYRNPSGSLKASRALRDKARRGGRAAASRRHHRRGQQRQHRQRHKHGRGGEGLPDGGRHATRRQPGARRNLTSFRRRGHHHRRLSCQRSTEKARERGSQPGYFAPQQFDSEWNVDENREWLGPEILSQFDEGQGRCRRPRGTQRGLVRQPPALPRLPGPHKVHLVRRRARFALRMSEAPRRATAWEKLPLPPFVTLRGQARLRIWRLTDRVRRQLGMTLPYYVHTTTPSPACPAAGTGRLKGCTCRVRDPRRLSNRSC